MLCHSATYFAIST